MGSSQTNFNKSDASLYETYEFQSKLDKSVHRSYKSRQVQQNKQKYSSPVKGRFFPTLNIFIL